MNNDYKDSKDSRNTFGKRVTRGIAKGLAAAVIVGGALGTYSCSSSRPEGMVTGTSFREYSGADVPISAEAVKLFNQDLLVPRIDNEETFEGHPIALPQGLTLRQDAYLIIDESNKTSQLAYNPSKTYVLSLVLAKDEKGNQSLLEEVILSKDGGNLSDGTIIPGVRLDNSGYMGKLGSVKGELNAVLKFEGTDFDYRGEQIVLGGREFYLLHNSEIESQPLSEGSEHERILGACLIPVDSSRIKRGLGEQPVSFLPKKGKGLPLYCANGPVSEIEAQRKAAEKAAVDKADSKEKTKLPAVASPGIISGVRVNGQVLDLGGLNSAE